MAPSVRYHHDAADGADDHCTGFATQSAHEYALLSVSEIRNAILTVLVNVKADGPPAKTNHCTNRGNVQLELDLRQPCVSLPKRVIYTNAESESGAFPNWKINH